MNLTPRSFLPLPVSQPPVASSRVEVVFETDIVPSYRCSNPEHGPACWVGEDGRHVIFLSFGNSPRVR